MLSQTNKILIFSSFVLIVIVIIIVLVVIVNSNKFFIKQGSTPNAIINTASTPLFNSNTSFNYKGKTKYTLTNVKSNHVLSGNLFFPHPLYVSTLASGDVRQSWQLNGNSNNLVNNIWIHHPSDNSNLFLPSNLTESPSLTTGFGFYLVFLFSNDVNVPPNTIIILDTTQQFILTEFNGILSMQSYNSNIVPTNQLWTINFWS